ncbi:Gfo/Idh/MocA family protein [Paenibacillus allorhizosphaerae]|uniref:Myo-inositol 2-dehydrogenase n=1 Tax=Paenibacillus allorhizosphaerae TaxID=2849866 RepID=A0ABN7TEH2_9BACL|nr:Gfo/Idh/MocA family oxidoreductase [Paenibacillus allorhizosphaerae]CAG7615284.1 Myo-inositol 2-dehydrogenase [Paenibacillus allorhizosphaerae]
MKQSFKITVIGTGSMGKQHVEGWQLAGHNVVSVVDLNLDAAREVASKFGVGTVLADYKEAINDPDIDIASICLPLKFHAPVTIYAAQQGKHVFCEKPLTSSTEHARAMEEAVREAGVQFGVGFQRTYAQDTALFRRLANDGELGRPLFFNSENLAEVRPKIAMHDAFGNMGPVMDVCCHSFFLWRTVFGSRAKTAYASGRVFAKDRPELDSLQQRAVDTASIVVEYESGDTGAMTVSWGLPKKTKIRTRCADRIIGPKGAVEAIGGGKWNVYIGDQIESLELQHGHLHEKQFRAFAQCLQEGTPYPVGLREGKEILALTEAVFRSIDSGRTEPVIYDAD